jgi:GntR family transcriptional regulator, carbon starvation induced regulator
MRIHAKVEDMVKSAKAPPMTETETEADNGTSRVVKAFDRLRMDILRAELEPGMRLRIEALQDRYGFSSSPLREALNRLASVGLVAAEDWRGFRVKEASLAELSDITRTRVLLEKEALKLAMTHGGDDWEAGILSAFHRMQLAQERLSGAELVLDEGWSERHRAFHHALRAGCGSTILLELCNTYFLQAERYRHLSARFRKLTTSVGASHQKLIDAVLGRRESQALNLIVEHIEGTSKRVSEALMNSPFAGPQPVPLQSTKRRPSRRRTP